MKNIIAAFVFLTLLPSLHAGDKTGGNKGSRVLDGAAFFASPFPDTRAAIPLPAAPRSIAPESAAQEGNTAGEIAGRCPPAYPNEPQILQTDFRWDYTLPEMLVRFGEMYASPKRLASRAYWDKESGTVKFPYRKDRGGDIAITPEFIQAVQRHIEKAFEFTYIDAVFFPDMGHSHLLIPDGLWKEKYAHYPVARMTGMYEDMFRDSSLRIFYHTAEQLQTREPDGQLTPDERTRFRYQTRNISGYIDPATDLYVDQNPESDHNTVNDVPGFHWWGAGFNLSAQRDGCFVYNSGGKSYRFDLSMFDLPYPGGGDF